MTLPDTAEADVILDYIRTFWQENGFAPSIRDIAASFERSVSTISMRLGMLRRRGLVTWEPGKGRTLRAT